MSSSTKMASATAALVLIALSGCDDETKQNPSAQSTTTSAGGNGSGGTGSGAMMSGPGGGGASGGCLEPSAYEAVFSLSDASLCVVATYTAPMRVGLDPVTYQSIVPTWGRHGGPLTMEQTFDMGAPQNQISLSRWTAPAASMGALSGPMLEGPLTPATNGNDPYMNPAAVDLPFNDWTAVGWATFGAPEGEADMLAAAIVRIPIAGLYSLAGVAEGQTQRLYHASLSPLDNPNAPTNVAVYATDICGAAPCTASIVLHAEGDASGPIALDETGNLMALMPDLAVGSQALRAWEASQIAPMAPTSAGNELGSLAGSGTALAALAPVAGSDGYVFLQPFDGNTFALGDVMVQRYRIEGTMVVAEGGVGTALALATAGAEVTLTAAPGGQLWVGTVTAESPVESTFFVVERAP